MELIYEQPAVCTGSDVNACGQMKLSAVLHYVQEAAAGHCSLLGYDWNTMAAKGLFWAVLRHKTVIHRLPREGESFTLRTWPVPATRTAYPRAVQALDEQGQLLFEVMSLWVLMDMESRGMVLPGKSGVEVPGVTREDQLSLPGSLIPGKHENSTSWTVSREDLDINGHVNNAKYLDRAEMLAVSAQRTPREFTVCYLSECRLGQSLRLHWTMSGEGVLTVDGCRPRTDVPEKSERVFAIKIEY